LSANHRFPDFLDLGGAETCQFAGRRLAEQVPQALVLDVEDEMETRQRGDDVAMLRVEVGEGGIVAENVHALSLVENHPNRAVLEDQACFAFKEHAHLLMKQ